MQPYACSQISDKYRDVWIMFEEKYPLKSFSRNMEPRADLILNAIDGKIKQILQDSITNKLELDIAFIQIYHLIYYAEDKINTLIPNATDGASCGYYQFLFYFLIYGCCLGSKYTKYMVPPKPSLRRPNNELLQYFVEEYCDKMDKSHIRYRYSNSQRKAIIDSVKQNAIIDEIALLIADFVAFEFEQFFFGIIQVFVHWEELRDTLTNQKLCLFWNMNNFSGGSLRFIMSNILLSNRFISSKDNDLEYFAQQMKFHSILYSPADVHHKMITRLFVQTHMIKAWTDSVGFIQLFETYPCAYMMIIFERCIQNKLSIFYNGNNEKIYFDHIDHEAIALINDNIHYLFDQFIIKYCIENKHILSHLLYQIINCLLYFVAKRLFKSNQILMHKLANIQGIIFQNVDYDAFIKIGHFNHSLHQLKSLKMSSEQYQMFVTEPLNENKRKLSAAISTPVKKQRIC